MFLLSSESLEGDYMLFTAALLYARPFCFNGLVWGL